MVNKVANNKSLGKKKSSKVDFLSDRGDNTSYHGPIVMRRAPEQLDIQKINTSYTATLTANGSGVVDTQYSSGGVTLVGDWASLAAVWHEYRVLGMEWHYIPNKNFVTTNQWPAMAVVIDRSSSAALGSYAAAANHESCTMHSSFEQIKKKMVMDGPEEAVWTTTATTFSWGYVKIFVDGAANTQLMGRVFITYLLQLRGRA